VDLLVAGLFFLLLLQVVCAIISSMEGAAVCSGSHCSLLLHLITSIGLLLVVGFV
jgi:hypothetical protein